MLYNLAPYTSANSKPKLFPEKLRATVPISEVLISTVPAVVLIPLAAASPVLPLAEPLAPAPPIAGVSFVSPPTPPPLPAVPLWRGVEAASMQSGANRAELVPPLRGVFCLII
mgnify:CR=1 FL=1